MFGMLLHILHGGSSSTGEDSVLSAGLDCHVADGKRSSERFLIPSPTNSMDLYRAPSTPIMPIICKITSLPLTHFGLAHQLEFNGGGNLEDRPCRSPCRLPYPCSPRLWKTLPGLRMYMCGESAPRPRLRPPPSPFSRKKGMLNSHISHIRNNWLSLMAAGNSLQHLQFSADFISLFGIKWSITRGNLILIKYGLFLSIFIISLMATGEVMSFPNLLNPNPPPISCPAFTSSKSCRGQPGFSGSWSFP